MSGQFKYTCNDDFFKEDNENSFYWAGFIAADGNLYKRKNYESYRLKLSLGKKDKEHIEKFRKTINSNHPIKEYNNSAEINIMSKEIFKDLEKFNIIPNKTLNYIFPEYVKDNYLLNHFMRGYIDGDGHYGSFLQKERMIPQHIFSIKGTERFLIDFKKILEEKSNFDSKSRVIKCKNSKIYNLTYYGNNMFRKIINYIYRDSIIYLNRKFNIIKDFITKSYF